MSSGLRLLLSLLSLCIAGCARQLVTVPDSDWQMVPAAQRAAIDKKHEADATAAHAELQAASAGLAEAQRSPATAAPPARTASAQKPDPDADPWTTAVHDHDQARVAARSRVEDARATWLRTRLTWRQLQVDAATARVALLVSDRELTRARAIDRTLPGSDHYDTAPLQGQFSRAQRRWHVADTAAQRARIAFERASASLASAKEAYAQLMRNGPVQLATPLPTLPDERPARLELTGWTITRGDLIRRKGLRHFLEVTARAPPQLRKRPFRLSPIPRARPEAPGPVPGAAPRASAPASETASVKPWDLVEPDPRPAGRPAPQAPRPAAGSAAAPSPAATATAKPAERPAARAPVSPNLGPSAPPSLGPAAPPAAGKPLPRAGNAATPASSAAGKPVQAPLSQAGAPAR